MISPYRKNVNLISSEQTLVELFNENYINIAEISSGKRPSSLGYRLDTKCGKFTIKANIKYSTRPSVAKTKEDFTLDKEFILPLASAAEISKTIKSINVDNYECLQT